jgi:hypothetical protein
MLILTVRPDSVSRTLLKTVNILLTLGESPEEYIRLFVEHLDEPVPAFGNID